MLATAHADIRKGLDHALLEKERSLQLDIKGKSERRVRLVTGKHTDEQLKSVDQEINSLLSDYQALEGRIRVASPAYAALTQPLPLNSKQVQQLLDDNTVLLEYALGEEHSFVFWVTSNSLSALEIPKRSEIDNAARHLYRLLTLQRRAGTNETKAQGQEGLGETDAELRLAAASLSRMVLGPVAAQLKNKRLLVVADGALQYIPFAMLPAPEAGSSASSGAPLVLNHEIVNLPSASVLHALRREGIGRKPASRKVAVLADPVFDQQDPRISSAGVRAKEATLTARGPGKDTATAGDSLSAGLLSRSVADVELGRGQIALPRLFFTREEASAIMASVPKGKGMEALDFDATRATAMSPELSQYRIVHFATHGLLNSEHPELSGLVFSLVDKNGKPQDGFLQLQDIYNLNLPADLVVLSACETALGKEINGEGLIGLTRGFMYAGASRVVASLWKVSDVATARLMAYFYSAMEKDGLPPAAALRAAQIQMWKQKRWSAPYYWAGFQIQGEWK
jgi:CHAT domain-containing protein